MRKNGCAAADDAEMNVRRHGNRMQRQVLAQRRKLTQAPAHSRIKNSGYRKETLSGIGRQQTMKQGQQDPTDINRFKNGRFDSRRL